MGGECISLPATQQFRNMLCPQAEMVGGYGCCSGKRQGIRPAVITHHNPNLCLELASLNSSIDGLHATSTVRREKS